MKKIHYQKLLLFILCFTITFLSLFGCSVKNDKDTASDNNDSNPENQEVTAVITHFSLELFKQSYSSSKNTLTAPFSVLLALALSANGANAETLSQMEEVFGISINQLNDYLSFYLNQLSGANNNKLSIANSIWLNNLASTQINESFLQINSDYYQAEVYNEAFNEDALDKINNWVYQNTDGMISNILDSISPDAIIYLLNAITFDAEWENIYSSSQVIEGEFHSITAQSQSVEFMNAKEYNYLEDEKATGFIKYYADEEYAFVALLPNVDVTLDEYVDYLTTKNLTNLITESKNIEVITSIPKFKSEYSIELSDVMINMGMVDAFDDIKADFSKMVTLYNDGNVFISQIIHKTFISVDERGTKAGATTVIQMDNTSAKIDNPKSVTLDRPFVYLIIDTSTNLPIFIGTLTSIE